MGAIGFGFAAGPPIGSLLAVVRCTTKLYNIAVLASTSEHHTGCWVQYPILDSGRTHSLSCSSVFPTSERNQ